jgi:hypothetical protein
MPAERATAQDASASAIRRRPARATKGGEDGFMACSGLLGQRRAATMGEVWLMNAYFAPCAQSSARRFVIGRGLVVYRRLRIKDLITARKENFAAGPMHMMRHARLLAAGILIVSSLMALAGLLLHNHSSVANLCSFADIEENGCGADAG